MEKPSLAQLNSDATIPSVFDAERKRKVAGGDLGRTHQGSFSTGTTNPSTLYQQVPQSCQAVALA